MPFYPDGASHLRTVFGCVRARFTGQRRVATERHPFVEKKAVTGTVIGSALWLVQLRPAEPGVDPIKMRRAVWILLVASSVAMLWFAFQGQMAKTPISLASVGTIPSDNGCEIAVSVDRRDRFFGLDHGPPPSLERAWLSDGEGRELAGDLLVPVSVASDGVLGSRQFTWRIPRTIPQPPATVLFHATFTAPGCQPFHFQDELQEGRDFNRNDADKAK